MTESYFESLYNHKFTTEDNEKKYILFSFNQISNTLMYNNINILFKQASLQEEEIKKFINDFVNNIRDKLEIMKSSVPISNLLEVLKNLNGHTLIKKEAPAEAAPAEAAANGAEAAEGAPEEGAANGEEEAKEDAAKEGAASQGGAAEGEALVEEMLTGHNFNSMVNLFKYHLNNNHNSEFLEIITNFKSYMLDEIEVAVEVENEIRTLKKTAAEAEAVEAAKEATKEAAKAAKEATKEAAKAAKEATKAAKEATKEAAKAAKEATKEAAKAAKEATKAAEAEAKAEADAIIAEIEQFNTKDNHDKLIEIFRQISSNDIIRDTVTSNFEKCHKRIMPCDPYSFPGIFNALRTVFKTVFNKTQLEISRESLKSGKHDNKLNNLKELPQVKFIEYLILNTDNGLNNELNNELVNAFLQLVKSRQGWNTSLDIIQYIRFIKPIQDIQKNIQDIQKNIQREKQLQNKKKLQNKNNLELNLELNLAKWRIIFYKYIYPNNTEVSHEVLNFLNENENENENE